MEFWNETIFRGKSFLSYGLDNLRVLLVRLAFAIHGCIATWRVTTVYNDPVYYILIIPIALLLVEFWVTAKYTENGDWGR